ncbi:hypothetical protein [Mycolicibacterium agri]|uniref:Uncharacterized protein n=1 Tax=Mycolicibacterium agri TaxID=36811 RepID=A0A7I9WBZ5_MYCAG|nr:hypothetical protein [Mycolicibacterium agri]GFG55241.1 hypothetical protein MAGR_66820 [Mycolicibacterium agri]
MDTRVPLMVASVLRAPPSATPPALTRGCSAGSALFSGPGTMADRVAALRERAIEAIGKK